MANSYIGKDTDLRKASKHDFQKDFFKLVNNSVLRKAMENVPKHRDIKLVTTEEERNYLMTEPTYHKTKFFSENFMSRELRKTQILMNKPVYLKLSILE